MTVTENLSVFFVAMYNKKNSTLNFLIEGYVPKKILLKEYDIMKRFYGLEAIENLPESQKKSLVSECRETGLLFTNQTLTDAAKILHVIKFINQ